MKSDESKQLTTRAVNTIRFLAVDGVEKANSGHPGMPMGMADAAFVLWTQFLRYNPDDPHWLNRDRFVLSAGHGSMLIYAMLHLAGYDLSIDDLKGFRQYHSKTPGHPELGHTPGVETTTGPLGQGFSNGVGMAIASKIQKAKFPALPVDTRIFSIISDGDLMEGVSSEAASLAGHLGLGNLIYLYDDNQITIEGKTELAFSEDVQKRFEAYGWHTVRIDGHDHAQIAQALKEGIAETRKPTLILAKTRIGFGSPGKEGTSEVHGAPLGPDEVIATKKALGWPLEPAFLVPDDVRELFQSRADNLKKEYDVWTSIFKEWKKSNPDQALLLQTMYDKPIPGNLEEQLVSALPGKPAATRAHGGKVVNKAAEIIPSLYGGSADLSPSTKTDIAGAESITKTGFNGRNLHFGIREHAMGSLMNGMVLHGGFIPYGSTFMVFADYMRPPIRLASIMRQQAIYIFTHDSIFVGEDGPTHQPVEHLAALRLIPRLTVFRPADGLETAMAWAFALRKKDGPTAICLTRQTVPILDRPPGFDPRTIQRGGYVLSDSQSTPDCILVSTGSEVGISIEAQALLQEQGVAVRVVSMPSVEAFNAQAESYKNSVIPQDGTPVAVVEAGVSFGWHAITRSPFLFLGMSDYGESGPYQILAKEYGFTGEAVAHKVGEWLKRQ